MLKKELIFLSAIILLGVLDYLTTVTGLFFFGASEVNPLLSGLIKSSMLLFSIAKLSAVALVGLAFYKAVAICESRTNDWKFTKRFLYGGYSLTFLTLTAIVANNAITIFRV
jgi:hypothetical protein